MKVLWCCHHRVSLLASVFQNTCFSTNDYSSTVGRETKTRAHLKLKTCRFHISARVFNGSDPLNDRERQLLYLLNTHFIFWLFECFCSGKLYTILLDFHDLYLHATVLPLASLCCLSWIVIILSNLLFYSLAGLISAFL